MTFKYAVLPKNPTKADIEAEIKRLENIKTDFQNQDQGLKIIINSLYGCSGYKGYIGYDIHVAASITGQSGDITRFMKERINVYFSTNYKLDVELHKKLGITPPIKSYEKSVKYCDTDSLFFIIDEVYEDSGYKGEFIDFALEIYNYRIKDYVAKKLHMYCDKYGAFDTKMDGQPSFKLALDYISHAILWTSKKKKYVKNIAWKKNIKYKSHEKIEITGLESNKAMVPKFVRDELVKILKKILVAHEDGKNISEIVNFEARRVRSDYDQKDINDICNVTRISDYEGFVVEDTNKITLRPNSSPALKGAALYNWILHNEAKDRNLHTRIETGMKVCTYTIGKKYGMHDFSFPVGEFPSFAPLIDKDEQFEKVFMKPLKNIVECLNVKLYDPQDVVIPPMW